MSDTLSDILHAVRLTCAVFFATDAESPVPEVPGAQVVEQRVLPGVEHVIELHVVTRGACWAGLLGEPLVRIEAGDVIVFPQGDPEVSSSARAKPARHAPFPRSIALSGEGAERVELASGFLGCAVRPFNPPLASLPRVIHIPQCGGSGSALRRLVELALAESNARRAGSDCVLSRLSELLFAEALRSYVAQLPPQQRGWFAGLRDESVGRALSKLHERPAHPWNLQALAKEVAMSRSMLAERFAYFVGVPPMHYLAKWRMHLAASLLRSSKASLAEIAERVGYGSETALSHAFKRELGIAPAPYRRRAHTSGVAAGQAAAH